MTITAEQQVVRTDAQKRLEELRAIAKSLWVDRDDAHVASELSVVMGQIRQAEALLNGEDGHGTP